MSISLYIKGKSDIFWVIKDSSYREKKMKKKNFYSTSLSSPKETRRVSHVCHTLWTGCVKAAAAAGLGWYLQCKLGYHSKTRQKQNKTKKLQQQQKKVPIKYPRDFSHSHFFFLVTAHADVPPSELLLLKSTFEAPNCIQYGYVQLHRRDMCIQTAPLPAGITGPAPQILTERWKTCGGLLKVLLFGGQSPPHTYIIIRQFLSFQSYQTTTND